MGAGASALPANVLSRPLAKEHLNKDLLMCFNFEKLAAECNGQPVNIQNVISAIQQNSDVYFCQDWLQDDIEISQRIDGELKSRGFRTLCTTTAKDAFAQQIDHTRLVLVFITKSFVDKIVNKSNTENNSDIIRQEFKYATLHKTSRRMLPIVLDADLKDVSKWEGVLGMTFGNSVIVDFSDTTKTFEMKCEELVRIISEKIGNSIEEIVSNIDWKQVEEDPNYRPLDTKGASKLAIDELNQWLVDNIQVPMSVAQAYSAIFVTGGVGSVSKLERKLKKHPDFFAQLTGIEAKDVDLIKAKLLPVSTGLEGKFNSSSSLLKGQHKPHSKHNLLGSPSNSSHHSHHHHHNKSKTISTAEEAKHLLHHWSHLEEKVLLSQLKQCIILLTDDRAMCESLGEQDKGSNLKAVVKLLKHFQAQEKVLVAILPLVNTFTRCGTEKTSTIIKNIELLGRFGVCDVIAEIVLANMSNKELLVLACTAVRNLTAAYVMSNQINFGYAGACETLTKVLTQYSNSADNVVQMALCAIWNLCGTEDNQHKFAACNIAEILKKLCRQHMSKPMILEPLFASIRILCYHHDNNKVTFGSVGMCENIVIAYSTHITHPMIVMHACGAIWNLANDSNNRQLFHNTNICELVVKTLTTQLQQAAVVETACGAIWALATNSPLNRIQLNEHGVCDAIILTLKTYKANVKIMELLCGALLVLIVQNTGLCIELLDSHLDVVFQPMQELYKDHREISHAIPIILKAIQAANQS